MKFGSLDNPENITEIYVGCAKWNRADLKGFYPRGTKDELGYSLIVPNESDQYQLF